MKQVHKTFAHTYQEEYDTLPLGPLVGLCLALAYFIRGNLIKVRPVAGTGSLPGTIA